MHRTRQSMPKTWILKKKGAKYISANGNSKTLPLFILIRDFIGEIENRSGVKKIIKENEVKVNNKQVHDNKFPIRLNDIVEINKKYYVLLLGENKKIQVKEIKENHDKITLRVIGKILRKDKKVQINCSNGRNYLVSDKESEKIHTGDSVIINLKDKKIAEIIQLKDNAKVLITDGKHIGKKGTIEKINRDKKIAEIKSKQEKINVLLSYLMVEK